ESAATARARWPWAASLSTAAPSGPRGRLPGQRRRERGGAGEDSRRQRGRGVRRSLPRRGLQYTGKPDPGPHCVPGAAQRLLYHLVPARPRWWSRAYREEHEEGHVATVARYDERLVRRSR